MKRNICLNNTAKAFWIRKTVYGNGFGKYGTGKEKER